MSDQLPDTTEAVKRALNGAEDEMPHWDDKKSPNDYLATAAIAADRKALAEAGYVIVPNKGLQKFIDEYMEMVDGEWESCRSADNPQLRSEFKSQIKAFGLPFEVNHDA